LTLFAPGAAFMHDKNDKVNSLVEKAEAAFLRASFKVIEISRRTETPIILWENGQVVELSADEVEQRLSKKLAL